VLASRRALGVFTPGPEALSNLLDGPVSRELPAPSQAASARLARSAAGGGFRLLEGRFDSAGLDPARLRAFLIFDGGELIVSARVRGLCRRAEGETPAPAFQCIAPAGALPDTPRRLGLLLSDGAREVYIERIDGQSLGARTR